MSHTLGPWILDSHGHVYAEAEYRPAPFVDLDGVEHPDFMAGLVALPYGNNARLIAAAPDLLEALEETADDIEAWAREMGWGPRSAARQRLDAIRAAIAKAKGGAS